MLDDSEWDKFRDQLQNEQNQAGLTHIAESLANLRDELRKKGFSDEQAFILIREYFCILVDRFYGPESEE